MKEIKSIEIGQQFAQGDILFERISELPDQINESNEHDKTEMHVIIAHSESGHHHVLERDKTTVYTPKYGSELIAYILVTEDTILEHQKSGKDAHESIKFPAGKYQVTRGREAMPEGYRRVSD